MGKTQRHLQEWKLNPAVVTERARQISSAIGEAVGAESARLGGYLNLQKEMERVLGDQFVERRRLKSIAEAANDGAAWISWKEMAALDVYWRSDGGLLSKL